jgi:hypothetical protein
VFDRWEVGAIVLVAIYVGVLGIVIRTGHFRRGVRNTYFNRELPGYMRNASFAFIPGGLAFLLIVAGAWLASRSRALGLETDPLANVLIVLGVLAFGVFFRWLFRPPEWTKPDWLRAHERAEAAGEAVPDMSPPPMTTRAYVLNWIGLGVGAALWYVAGLPLGPLLIGLGIGVSLLVVNQPRRRA